jgi:hypothetical protein
VPVFCDQYIGVGMLVGQLMSDLLVVPSILGFAEGQFCDVMTVSLDVMGFICR